MSLAPELDANIQMMMHALHMPEIGDCKRREFKLGDAGACLFFMEGMAGQAQIDKLIMEPCRSYSGALPMDAQSRIAFITAQILTANDVVYNDLPDQIARQVLEGKTALIVDGCPEALLIETRNYEKRPVGKTITESVVMGAQQGFVESLRTNITLIRRILKSAQLTTEMHTVGSSMPTSLAILYLHEACEESALREVRRRILCIDAAHVPDIGQLQQLIEDRRFMILPRTLLTERPDRACHLISEGHIAIVMDNSPYALIAPVSLFDFLCTADDNFMRSSYSTFNRLVRISGLFISLMLPGFYVALTMFHTQMIPMELLISIATARVKVPFPVIIELLIMEFSFYLINEAGTRMPSQIGSALGIVGALILGQAAVSANIISPLLIIIAALTGLGNYAIPDYGLGIAVQIVRLAFLFAGATMGLFGMAMATFICAGLLSAMDSFGQPYLSPRSPWRPGGRAVVLQTPSWRLNRMPFGVSMKSWLKRTPHGSKMRGWEDDE